MRDRWFALSLAGLAVTFALLATAHAGELKVQTDFPGGSGKVLSIDQQSQTIHIAPAKHDNRGWRLWWYVKVVGIEPGTRATQVGDLQQRWPALDSYEPRQTRG